MTAAVPESGEGQGHGGEAISMGVIRYLMHGDPYSDPPRAYVCDRCGALVGDQESHTRWHEAEEPESGAGCWRMVEPEHQLIGSVCICGDWSAGCGNDIPAQWASHLRGVTPPAPEPSTEREEQAR